jgi:hypothetical protein
MNALAKAGMPEGVGRIGERVDALDNRLAAYRRNPDPVP